MYSDATAGIGASVDEFNSLNTISSLLCETLLILKFFLYTNSIVFFLKDLNSNKHFDFDDKLVTIKLSSTEIKLQ